MGSNTVNVVFNITPQYSRSDDGISQPVNATYQGLYTEPDEAKQPGADQQEHHPMNAAIELQAMAGHSEDGYLMPISPSRGSDEHIYIEPMPEVQDVRKSPYRHGCKKHMLVAAVILAVCGVICGFVLIAVLNSE